MKSRQWSKVSGAMVWCHESNGLVPREQCSRVFKVVVLRYERGAFGCWTWCFCPYRARLLLRHATQGDALGYLLLALQAVFCAICIAWHLQHLVTQDDARGYELLAFLSLLCSESVPMGQEQAVFVPSAISLPMFWGVGKLQIVTLFCFLSTQYFTANYVCLIDEET